MKIKRIKIVIDAQFSSELESEIAEDALRSAIEGWKIFCALREKNDITSCSIPTDKDL